MIFKINRDVFLDHNKVFGNPHTPLLSWGLWMGSWKRKDDDADDDTDVVHDLENNDGFHGAVDRDQRSKEIVEVDIPRIEFLTYFDNGQSRVSGVERYTKSRNDPNRVCLDTYFVYSLWREKDWATLEFIYTTTGVRWFEVTGEVLRGPNSGVRNGGRYFAALIRTETGGRVKWELTSNWVGLERRRLNLVAMYPKAALDSRPMSSRS